MRECSSVIYKVAHPETLSKSLEHLYRAERAYMEGCSFFTLSYQILHLLLLSKQSKDEVVKWIWF